MFKVKEFRNMLFVSGLIFINLIVTAKLSTQIANYSSNMKILFALIAVIIAITLLLVQFTLYLKFMKAYFPDKLPKFKKNNIIKFNKKDKKENSEDNCKK